VTKISVCGACTCHQNDLFFSYRKDKSAGRMMSLIRI